MMATMMTTVKGLVERLRAADPALVVEAGLAVAEGQVEDLAPEVAAVLAVEAVLAADAVLVVEAGLAERTATTGPSTSGMEMVILEWTMEATTTPN